MRVKFENPGLGYMLESIMAFQKEDSSFFWSEPLFYFYPQLDKAYVSTLKGEGKRKYIENVLSSIYKEQEKTIEEKVEIYSSFWGEHERDISMALSDAFSLDSSDIFNDLRCYVSMNPISPRFLSDGSFEVFYLNSGKGAIGTAIHEIIHFFWFYVWNDTFHDSYEEYERPSLKWILSEMVVESIMKDERLSSINPYFPRENGGCIYPYFFDMYVDDKPILETIDSLYVSNPIEEFMVKSFDYCRKHEIEIRAHIEASENK